MEKIYYFKISYNKNYVCTIGAHSNFEAIDKAFYKYVWKHPYLSRKLLKAKKV